MVDLGRFRGRNSKKICNNVHHTQNETVGRMTSSLNFNFKHQQRTYRLRHSFINLQVSQHHRETEAALLRSDLRSAVTQKGLDLVLPEYLSFF